MKTILVVDDEVGLREILREEMEGAGFGVLEAENGTKAFEIASNNPVDLVITDIRMGGGNGIELLDRLKTLDAVKPVILMVTGFSISCVAPRGCVIR